MHFVASMLRVHHISCQNAGPQYVTIIIITLWAVAAMLHSGPDSKPHAAPLIGLATPCAAPLIGLAPSYETFPAIRRPTACDILTDPDGPR